MGEAFTRRSESRLHTSLLSKLHLHKGRQRMLSTTTCSCRSGVQHWQRGILHPIRGASSAINKELQGVVMPFGMRSHPAKCRKSITSVPQCVHATSKTTERRPLQLLLRLFRLRAATVRKTISRAHHHAASNDGTDKRSTSENWVGFSYH